MNWDTGLIRLWAVASVVWIIAVAAALRLDLTFSKFMRSNMADYRKGQSFTEEQLAALESATRRLSLAAQDDLVHGLILIFVPIVASLWLVIGLKWVISGFKHN
jgi:hypothetical protein